MNNHLLKLTPRAPKFLLNLMAGVMWVFVGLLLNRFAYHWLLMFDWPIILLLALAGAVLALAIYTFGFSRLARRNVERIEAIEAKNPCIFAFQQWSSYPIVIIMISLGIYLRKYSGLPEFILAPTYIGIGGSLFLAGLIYFKKLLSFRKS